MTGYVKIHLNYKFSLDCIFNHSKIHFFGHLILLVLQFYFVSYYYCYICFLFVSICLIFFWMPYQFSSVQLLSRVRLCDPMNRSTPGLPVHHHLPEFPQTHVHRVSDAIQPSHPQSSPSSPAPNPSQHQSLFQ